MVLEAHRVQKGSNPVLECLLFLGIFLITQIVIGLLIGFPLGAYAMYQGLADASGAAAANPAVLNEKLAPILMTGSLYGELIGIFLILGLCRWFQKRKGWTLGFKKGNILKEYGVGMGAGFLMMTAAVLMAWITGALTISVQPQLGSLKTAAMLLVLFVGFLFQGMFEEVLCRGYFLVSLARRKGNLWMAILVSSLAFAALHLANAGISLLAFLNLTLYGIFAGLYFVKRGNLWGIGAFHSLWNFTQGNIWGVLVSGNNFGPSVFTAQMNDNLPLLNGGSFGLEGGLLVSIVLIAGSLILLKLPQKDTVSPEEFPAAAANTIE